MSTCNRLDLQTLGCLNRLCPNNLPDHWIQPPRTMIFTSTYLLDNSHHKNNPSNPIPHQSPYPSAMTTSLQLISHMHEYSLDSMKRARAGHGINIVCCSGITRHMRLSLSNLLHLYKVFKFESCKNRHVNIITGVINYDEAI